MMIEAVGGGRMGRRGETSLGPPVAVSTAETIRFDQIRVVTRIVPVGNGKKNGKRVQLASPDRV